jgi:hypothetical protein
VRQGQGDPAPDQVLAEAIIWHELKPDKIHPNQSIDDRGSQFKTNRTSYRVRNLVMSHLFHVRHI